MREENEFWKVCEALDCEKRIELLRYLIEAEQTEFLCVNELAEKFAVSSAAMSVHLKKLATAGLVVSKRSEGRVYYRAFASTEDGERVVAVMREFFASNPDRERVWRFLEYAHALSHARRNAIVRCLERCPGLSVRELADRIGMPPHTADRLCGVLNKARIVDLNGRVIPPAFEPESTLLTLTLKADSPTFN